MPFEFRGMVIADYPQVYRLWSTVDGLSLGEDDSPDGIALYLKRNVGLCFVAEMKSEIVGCVLCGHDGRRGVLRHLAVHPVHRGHGVAKQLVRACLDALSAQGIRKCNLYVMDYHQSGMSFWKHLGFSPLPDEFRTLQSETIVKSS